MASIITPSYARPTVGRTPPVLQPIDFETGTRAIGDHRRVVHSGSTVRIVDISASASRPPPPGHAANYQIVLPYLGVLGYSVGSATRIYDANRTLFVTANRDFSDSHPVPGVGHASLVLVPACEVLEELCGKTGPAAHIAFKEAAGPVSRRLHMLTHRIRSLSEEHGNPLAADELAIAAMSDALAGSARQKRPVSSNLVDRAKQVLHARGCERLGLDDIAGEVGVTGVYLTREFSRTEGMSLCRYQMRLRLSRALVDLPHCDNITELAFDLGFSSHSHFSAAFKSAFGVTPSQFRAVH